MSTNFPKSEKLCGQLRIASLYKEGQRFTAFPLRVTVRKTTDENGKNAHISGSDFAPRVLIWTPKSLFKHAVDRNHLRRLMREAYRLQAQPLRDFCADNQLSLQLAFNYMDREIRTQQQINKAMSKALNKLQTMLGEPTAKTRQRDGNETATRRQRQVTDIEQIS